MAWYPSTEYWAKKITGIERAIDNTLRDTAMLAVHGASQKELDAHAAQVNSLRKSLDKARRDFSVWRNKQQNIERGARY